MASEALDQVENVEIDPSGNFKYILITITDSAKNSKNIVRGNIAAGFYHADIFEDFQNRIKSLKLKSKCLGGGRIDHQPDRKYIKVYSYSQGFGQADHRIAVDLLKSKYSDYKIEWSNDDD